MPLDPDWANLKLLLHCDGSNGSTTFIDSSSVGRTVTAAGDAAVSTAQSKIGGASLYCDGTGDYLDIPDAADLEFGSADFTVALWFRPDRVNVNQQLIGRQPGTASYVPWFIYLNSSGQIEVFLSFNNSTFPGGTRVIIGGSLSINTWYHFALTRSGSSFRAFLNGSQIGSTYTSANGFTNYANGTYVGRSGSGVAYKGYVDEVAIWTNVAKYTAGFTPETTEWYGEEPANQIAAKSYYYLGGVAS